MADATAIDSSRYPDLFVLLLRGVKGMNEKTSRGFSFVAVVASCVRFRLAGLGGFFHPEGQ